MPDELEPLDASLWLQAFSRLLISVERAGPDGITHNIRQAYHLIKLAPGPFRPIFGDLLSEATFEILIEESESLAAISLLGATLKGDGGLIGREFGLSSPRIIATESGKIEVVNLTSARSIVVGLANLVKQLDNGLAH